MRVVGKTVDGKPVVGGLFYYYDTLGLPMDVILSFCADNGCVPDFLGSSLMDARPWLWTI